MEPIKTEIVVLGAGPGGYTAAFYAADRGKKVTLVEQNSRLGGICLNSGCILQGIIARHGNSSRSQVPPPRINSVSLKSISINSALGRIDPGELGQGIGLAQKRGVK
jgi:pyruvate/2-oxoglutarate dehydrogenase complex dihydrolipoamide dehydrogenase (E3) component